MTVIVTDDALGGYSVSLRLVDGGLDLMVGLDGNGVVALNPLGFLMLDDRV